MVARKTAASLIEKGMGEGRFVSAYENSNSNSKLLSFKKHTLNLLANFIFFFLVVIF